MVATALMTHSKPLLRTFAFALLGTMAALSAEAAAWGPRPAACPAPVPAQTRCYTGADAAGALYWSPFRRHGTACS